jgi:hypothetical protein
MIPAGTIPASRARSTEASVCPGPHQHSALARAQREHVPGTRQIRRLGRGIDRHLNRARAVVRRNSGRHSLARVDRLAKRRAVLRRVLRGHRTDVQMLEPLLGHSQADQAAPIFRHEVDGFGSNFFRGEGQVALVLAVFVVDHHDHAARADFLDGIGNIGKWRLGTHNDAILAEGTNSICRYIVPPDG